MAIKIVVSNKVGFKVVGKFNDPDGNASEFSFRLTAKRLTQDELTQAISDAVIDAAKNGNHQKIADTLIEITTDWGDVKDADSEPVSYSADGLRGLFTNYPGLALHTWRSYQDEVGVKAKN
jgi:hypothetical protein